MKKRALITGGTGGIGTAICKQLAADEHHVIIHTHSKTQQAHLLAADIKQTGGSAEVISCDLTDQGQTFDAVTTLLQSGPIQILINNAGCHQDAPLAGMSAEQWQSVLNLSLNGFYNMTQPLLLPMMATRWGRIINISSVAGLIGNRGQTNYAAAKAGLHGATKSLALELASRGITVNAVAPGIINTSMSEDFDDEKIRQLVPMQRAGHSEEVAHLVSFLSSDHAAYISGQVISINGGMT